MQANQDVKLSPEIILSTKDRIMDFVIEDYNDVIINKRKSNFNNNVAEYLKSIQQQLSPNDLLKLNKRLLLCFHPDKTHELQGQYTTYTVRTKKKYENMHYEHCLALQPRIVPILTENVAAIDSPTSTTDQNTNDDFSNNEILTRNRWHSKVYLMLKKIEEKNQILKFTKNAQNDPGLTLSKKEGYETTQKNIEKELEELKALQEALYHHPLTPSLEKIVHDAANDTQQFIRLILSIYYFARSFPQSYTEQILNFVAVGVDAIKTLCIGLLSYSIDLSSFNQAIAMDRLQKEKEWIAAQKNDIKFVNLNQYDDPIDIFYVDRGLEMRLWHIISINPIKGAFLKGVMGSKKPEYLDYTSSDGESTITHTGEYRDKNGVLYHRTMDMDNVTYTRNDDSTIKPNYDVKIKPIYIDVCYQKVKTIAKFQQLKNEAASSPYYAYYVSIEDDPSKLYYFSKHTYQYPTPHLIDYSIDLPGVHFTFDIAETDQSTLNNFQQKHPLSVEEITNLEKLTQCPEIQNKKPIELLAKMRQELQQTSRCDFNSRSQTQIINDYLAQILAHRQSEQYYLQSHTKHNLLKQKELTINSWLCLYLLGKYSANAVANSLNKNLFIGALQALCIMPILMIYAIAFLLGEMLELLLFMNKHIYLLADAVIYNVAAAPTRVARFGASFFHNKAENDTPPPTTAQDADADAYLPGMSMNGIITDS